ncbi:MAG: methyltransferase type 11 [Alphaproteobacteria bacterium]
MWTDVIDLNAFYRSRLGATARGLIQQRIRALWPDVHGLSVAGLGYATPYLKVFRGEAERVLAVMPAYQGVTPWPRQEKSLVCLSEETQLPFGDLSIDRLLVVHMLENTERLRDTLLESWRVLNGVGKLIVVVPARRGFWSRNERTPFGHGKPFSLAQLTRLLRDTSFEPGEAVRALYMPPVRRQAWLPFAEPVERIGSRMFSRFGGVHILEATKQVYSVTPAKPVRRRVLISLPTAVNATRQSMFTALDDDAETPPEKSG